MNVREVLNANFYVLSTGCQWQASPKDLPPKSTAHSYFMLWDWDGGIIANGYPSGIAALHGRYADLVILGQLDAYDPQADLVHPRPEGVAMLAGRPVLAVPYTGHFSGLARRVLIGWDASREAARAIKDEMPLLAQAEAVTVLTIDAEQSPQGHGEVPGADIAQHLARHRVKVRVERTVSAGIGVGNTLLSRAAV